MPAPERCPSASILTVLCRRTIPVLIGAMLLVTGVAVVLGWLAYCSRLGSGQERVALAEYSWIVFWTGLAEFVSLVIGVVVLCFVSRRITRPLTSLSETAVRLARNGGSASFRTDGPISEINDLSSAFNELFALRERQTEEVRNLSRNVLHDLRTPLTHIRHCAELVHEGRTDVLPAMETVAEACNSVLSLVDTNAEISANYSGLDAIPPEDLDVSKIVSDLADMYAVVAESKRISFSVSLPDVPVRFCGHRDRIQRLLVNLLDNAFKFTPEGGRVILSAESDSEELRLQVSDSGIGIADADRPHVFERFYRVRSGRQTSGNGLGLSLVHAIVTFYRGTVDFQSSEGYGTVFTVRLPSGSAKGAERSSGGCL